MKKKTVALLMACMMVLGVAIGGTMAWLTDKTPSVINTFTIGDINIALDETTGTAYDYIPGGTVTKDPKVTVTAGSEAHYLFVEIKVAKNVGVDTANNLTVAPVLNWEIADGWKYYDASTQAEGTVPEDFVNGTYYFYREVAKTEKTDTAPVFPVLKNNQVTVSPEVTKGMVTGLNTTGEQPTLTFTAAAVQSENLPDAATDNDDTTLTTLGVAFKQISWTA